MSDLFKKQFCWWPVRLARNVDKLVGRVAGKDIYEPKMEFIGWVWMQEAYLTNNLNHGWVAFLDSKPLKPRCSKCGQDLPE